MTWKCQICTHSELPSMVWYSVVCNSEWYSMVRHRFSLHKADAGLAQLWFIVGHWHGRVLSSGLCSKFEGRPLFSLASSILSSLAAARPILVLTQLESVCTSGGLGQLKQPIFYSFQQTNLSHHWQILFSLHRTALSAVHCSAVHTLLLQFIQFSASYWTDWQQPRLALYQEYPSDLVNARKQVASLS